MRPPRTLALAVVPLVASCGVGGSPDKPPTLGAAPPSTITAVSGGGGSSATLRFAMPAGQVFVVLDCLGSAGARLEASRPDGRAWRPTEVSDGRSRVGGVCRPNSGRKAYAYEAPAGARTQVLISADAGVRAFRASVTSTPPTHT